MSFIVIDDDVSLVDTEAEIQAAQEAMRQAGRMEARVYVGDPSSPETYPNGQILFAE